MTIQQIFGGRKIGAAKKSYDGQQSNNGGKIIHSNDTMITNKMMTKNILILQQTKPSAADMIVFRDTFSVGK